LAAPQGIAKEKHVDILIACTVVAVLILYFIWKSGAFSSARNVAPAENKAAAQSPAQSPLDHKALIQDENFHILQGMAYADAGLLDQAIFEEKEASRVNPRSFPAWNNIGFFLFKAGRYADSARALEQALRLQPTLELVQNNLRNSYDKALETATPAQKESLRQRKEKLDAGTLVDFLNQGDQAGVTPNR